MSAPEGEAVFGGTARHEEAAVGAGVGGGERLVEHVRHPREALLDGLAVLAAAPILSGLAHPLDHLLQQIRPRLSKTPP